MQGIILALWIKQLRKQTKMFTFMNFLVQEQTINNKNKVKGMLSDYKCCG